MANPDFSDSQLVFSHLNEIEQIRSVIAGSGIAGDSRAGIGQRDFCADHDAPGLVGDRAAERSVRLAPHRISQNRTSNEANRD